MICSTCKVDKPTSEFNKDRAAKTGLQGSCRECKKSSSKKWRQENLAYCQEYSRQYYAEHSEEMNEYHRQWNAANAEKVLEDAKRNYWKDPRKATRQNTANSKKRRKTDPDFKLRGVLRTRQKKVMKKQKHGGSFIRDLGCSVPEILKHIESKFQPGMSWGNHGSGENKWNLDHIIPLAKFDLTNRQHFVLAANYMNLQPLWHKENMKKRDAYVFAGDQ